MATSQLTRAGAVSSSHSLNPVSGFMPILGFISNAGSSIPVASTTSTTSTAPSVSTYIETIMHTPTTTSRASQPTKAPYVCPADNGKTYRTQNGQFFIVHCSTDYEDHDQIKVDVSSGSISECIEACSKARDCEAVALSGVACYLKSEAGLPRNNSLVIGAKKAEAPADEVEHDGVVCPALHGKTIKTPCGSMYQIECNTDRPGGDRKQNNPVYTKDLQGCFSDCDADARCVNIDWVHGASNGPCYLKDSKEPKIANGNVDNAIKMKGCTRPSSRVKRQPGRQSGMQAIKTYDNKPLQGRELIFTPWSHNREMAQNQAKMMTELLAPSDFEKHHDRKPSMEEIEFLLLNRMLEGCPQGSLSAKAGVSMPFPGWMVRKGERIQDGYPCGAIQRPDGKPNGWTRNRDGIFVDPETGKYIPLEKYADAIQREQLHQQIVEAFEAEEDVLHQEKIDKAKQLLEDEREAGLKLKWAQYEASKAQEAALVAQEKADAIRTGKQDPEEAYQEALKASAVAQDRLTEAQAEATQAQADAARKASIADETLLGQDIANGAEPGELINIEPKVTLIERDSTELDAGQQNLSQDSKVSRHLDSTQDLEKRRKGDGWDIYDIFIDGHMVYDHESAMWQRKMEALDRERYLNGLERLEKAQKIAQKAQEKIDKITKRGKAPWVVHTAEKIQGFLDNVFSKRTPSPDKHDEKLRKADLNREIERLENERDWRLDELKDEYKRAKGRHGISKWDKKELKQTYKADKEAIKLEYWRLIHDVRQKKHNGGHV